MEDLAQDRLAAVEVVGPVGVGIAERLERVGAAVREAEAVHGARVARILAERLDGVRDVRARAKCSVHEQPMMLGTVIVRWDPRVHRGVQDGCSHRAAC